MKTVPNCYDVWASMKARCSNPNRRHWHRYGGRGIHVCERWQTFANFYADMGDKPAGKTLDRIDNDRGYEPGNCRWATQAEQHNNKCDNRRVTIDGRTQTLTQWARESGIGKNTLQSRAAAAWPEAMLLIQPHPNNRVKEPA